MCADPTTAMVMQGVGAAQSAIGAYGAAASQKSSLRYQAQIADLNAVAAERQAQVAMQRGQFQVDQVRRSTAGLKGSQRAQMAANGVDLTTGTPAEVLTSTDLMGEIDAQQAEINAVREAWGYRQQGAGFTSDAMAGRANASAISPMAAATTSLLGSATSMASSFYSFQKAGAFGGSKTSGGGWGASGKGG